MKVVFSEHSPHRLPLEQCNISSGAFVHGRRDSVEDNIPLNTSTLGRLKISRSVLPPLVELSATSMKTSLSTLHWGEKGKPVLQYESILKW